MATATPIPNLFRLILTAVLCTSFYFIGFYQNFRGNVTLPSLPSPTEDLPDERENATSCDLPKLFPPLDFFAHHFLPETPAVPPPTAQTVHMKRYHRRVRGPYAAEQKDDKTKKDPATREQMGWRD